MKIKVVGIGGIGCCLLPTLIRFINFSSEGETEIILVDGDRFEEKNRERQVFSRLGNKADVTVARFGEEFPGLHIRSVSEYVTEGNVVSLIREGDVIFLCVDNHSTRKLVSDRCEELSDAVLISGGNEFTDGNVQIFIRRGGKNVTLPLANSYHPEIMNPEDQNPEEAGCDELVESEPQLLITNNAIAAAMLNCFYAYLQGRLVFDELYVDVVTGNYRPVARKPEHMLANP